MVPIRKRRQAGSGALPRPNGPGRLPVPPSRDPVLSENSIRLGIRIVGQNHRMIGADACNPLLARNVHRRPVQVAAQSAYDGPDIP
jgi:hypothetical protein